MIGWEKRVLLRHYLAQGLTKAVIAERLGINRRTINRWISKGATSTETSMRRFLGMDRGRRCRPSSIPSSRSSRPG